MYGLSKAFLLISSVLLVVFSSVGLSTSQRRDPTPSRPNGFTLLGDFNVDEKEAADHAPLSYGLILYTKSGILFDRQTLGSKGRYRFINVPPGEYEIRVEVEGTEIARVSILIVNSPTAPDVRQDINLEWKRGPDGGVSTSATYDVSDQYQRSSVNANRFVKANKAKATKDYPLAAGLLSEITADDPKDFQAWTLLADIHFLQKNLADAEGEYLHAIDSRPGFFPALLNLGRLEVARQRYEVAIGVLTRAVKTRSDSPDANYFLGEAYLQVKKGSLAVEYLNEALRLDPQGMAEVHLRLAALYHAAGMMDKAALQYEMFLKKRPNYPEKERLKDYIATSKKQ